MTSSVFNCSSSIRFISGMWRCWRTTESMRNAFASVRPLLTFWGKFRINSFSWSENENGNMQVSFSVLKFSLDFLATKWKSDRLFSAKLSGNLNDGTRSTEIVMFLKTFPVHKTLMGDILSLSCNALLLNTRFECSNGRILYQTFKSVGQSRVEITSDQPRIWQ